MRNWESIFARVLNSTSSFGSLPDTSIDAEQIRAVINSLTVLNRTHITWA